MAVGVAIVGGVACDGGSGTPDAARDGDGGGRDGGGAGT